MAGAVLLITDLSATPRERREARVRKRRPDAAPENLFAHVTIASTEMRPECREVPTETGDGRPARVWARAMARPVAGAIMSDTED